MCPYYICNGKLQKNFKGEGGLVSYVYEQICQAVAWGTDHRGLRTEVETSDEAVKLT